jgi:hypothetical protein
MSSPSISARTSPTPRPTQRGSRHCFIRYQIICDWFLSILLCVLNARLSPLNVFGIHRRVKDITLFGQ